MNMYGEKSKYVRRNFNLLRLNLYYRKEKSSALPNICLPEALHLSVDFSAISVYNYPVAFEQVVARNMKGALSGTPCFYCRGAWEAIK